ncbi:tRNA dihydrouridine(20/20a) synthase DusA [Jiella sp. CBK1P-4]|uniref:tRNA-dihydrouridine(20/20a) synthase n=2 Tax=Jiella avicenniae TaxID=2907202 RepID=A0A9X1T7W6_9HYPH|nr:tRNA dihydrouridine(20/20a) synthase DusA [Jiella avicenniae]
MIDWTDRHCRFFHRQLSRRAKLFTEMIVDEAVLHGDLDRLLGHDAAEHPVALQLGGSNPDKLARATRIALDFGYDEINLNVGCPSDRVQSGTFGACLMREPALVGECLAAMVAAAGETPVTVKCRLGVDEQDVEEALDALADAAVSAAVAGVWVHARKAWLDGLSPKENREIPPLDYDRVRRLKARLGSMFVGLNGGLKTLEQASAEASGLDGVMFGRAAYQTPDVLIGVDAALCGEASADFDHDALIETMVAYTTRHVSAGGKVGQVTRHMTGLFSGRPGARRWRQILSEGASRPGASPDLIREAFRQVRLEPASEAA